MPKSTNSEKLTYAQIKARKKPTLKRVPVSMDGEKAELFNAARRAFDAADAAVEEDPRNKAKLAVLADAREKLEELRPQVEDDVVEFIFRSIGRKGFEDVVESCPPTKEQRTAAERKGEEVPGWNEDTFPQTLIAAAIVSPEFSEEDAFELWDDPAWNQAELIALFLAALTVNQENKVADLGKGSGLTLV